MSNQRINIIAALSTIALCATSSTTAQTSASTTNPNQEPSALTSSSTSTSDSSSATPDTSTALPATNDKATTRQRAASNASSTQTEPSTTSLSSSSQSVSDSTSPAPGASMPAATSQASGGAGSKAEIKRADSMAEQLSAAKLKGQRVRDSGGNEIGKINDFIIDGASGKIAHVVISTGGVLGVGDKLRLIPGANLKRSGNDFTSDMAQTEFEALPTISEKDLKASRIVTQAATSSQSSNASASLPTGQGVRASQLKERSIRSDDHQVGKIEHVVIDLEKGQAMALIDANSAFAGESGKFLVPFSRLEVRSAEDEHISSSLLKSDFAGLHSSDTAATTPRSSTPSTAQSTGTSSSTSAPQIAGATTPTPAATSATISSTTSESTAAKSTDGQVDRSETSQSVATSGIGAQDTASRSEVTGSSPSIRQSGSSTTASSSSASTSPSSTDSTQGFANTPGTTTSDAAITGDTTRSPRLADTANAPADPASTNPTVVTNTPSPVPADEQLTPTGRSSAEQSPASGAAAMAIRQALDSDAMVAREDVQVTTKIVLQGSVKSEEAKNRIEELAKKAANNAEIDNQIKVQPQ